MADLDGFTIGYRDRSDITYTRKGLMGEPRGESSQFWFSGATP